MSDVRTIRIQTEPTGGIATVLVNRGPKGDNGITQITSTTAPSDTSVIWIDPETGIQSVYSGGGWVTQLTATIVDDIPMFSSQPGVNADNVVSILTEKDLSVASIELNDGVNPAKSAIGITPAASSVRYLRVNADDSVSELSQTQLLSDLTPSRLLYVNDLPATFFNGTNSDSVSVIPLTAAQAVVGTKIRCRGFIEAVFQGTAANIGNPTFGLIFNNFSNAANVTEGAIFIIGQGAYSRIGVDLEIELKAGATGKYYVGLSSTHTKNGSIIKPGGSDLWGVDGADADGSAPTVSENIAATNPILVKVVAYGGITNLSICSLVIDINYEITTP